MLDHVTVKVGDFGRAKAFYDAALKPLALGPVMGDGRSFMGYGPADRPFFWISFHSSSV